MNYSIAINIIGLAVIGAVEAWRPGLVSGSVNVGVVWICAMILLGAGLAEKK